MGGIAMRIRMPVLAAGLVAGALAYGAISADATPQIALNGFIADSPMTVMVDAPPEAMGAMCFISQSGMIIGGGQLHPGPNSFMIATTGTGGDLVADGLCLMATRTDTFDDVEFEE
jgi:hypothetical protein